MKTQAFFAKAEQFESEYSMNQEKTGKLIRTLRLEKGLTQAELAAALCVSDKAVSKWERGCGSPDVGILPLLADTFNVSVEALLSGGSEKNRESNGNMKKTKVYLCPTCGNAIFSTDEADLSCCGKKLLPLEAKKADDEHLPHIEKNDGDWFLSSAHDMNREHRIVFTAFLNGDTLIVKKQYPEWDYQVRIPFAHGTLLICCSKHGLFFKNI